jgi:ribosomal protein S25
MTHSGVKQHMHFAFGVVMKSKVSTFDLAVSQVRAAIRRRLRRERTISALNIANVALSVKGARRGAVVRTAFRQLESEGVIEPTAEQAYNERNRHYVTVYSRKGR